MGNRKMKDRQDRGKPKNEGAKGKKNAWVRSVMVSAAILIGITGAAYYFGTEEALTGTSYADVESLKGGETRPTLPPSQFVGKVAAAYKVARDNPELLDSLYCYCHCKQNFGHKSLLSCYVDQHAANCSICLDQAFYAQSLFNQGTSIADIRKAEDRKFWKPLR